MRTCADHAYVGKLRSSIGVGRALASAQRGYRDHPDEMCDSLYLMLPLQPLVLVAAS